jgi:hypothetical protein
VAAAKLAKNDWILLIDPDEHLGPHLVQQIQDRLAAKPNVGSLRLPWGYYFKRKRLDGTIWGGGRTYKRMLIHRDRCRLLPFCNRIVEPIEGFEYDTIEHDGQNHLHHY